MYKIKTSDGKEHGPYMANVVEQWITAGKTDDDTLLQKVGEPDWKPCSAFPPFAALVSRSEPGSGEGKGSRPGLPSAATQVSSAPRTSAMAVASLILGLLGVTALFGLILGIIAQMKISRAGESLKGSGYAVSGMVISGIMLLFGVPILIGLLVPPWVRAQEQAHADQCLARATLIAESLDQYAGEHEGMFPNPAIWCDALVQSAGLPDARSVLVCPAEPRVRSGFALNSNLVEVAVSNMHPRTVLFFESKAGWNGHGGFPQLANYRHRGKVTVGFVDGSAEAIPVWQIPQLRWLP